MTASHLIFAATPTPSLAQFGGSGSLAGFFVVGIIIVLVLIAGGLASVGGLIYIWIRALKQPALDQGLANCGRCGYGVRGTATLQCPECGADFREVGIRSPSMRKPFIGPALFITLWSLCLWIPGCVVSSVVVAAGPQQKIHYEDVDLNPPDTKAAGYDNLTLSQTPHGLYSNWIAEVYPQQSRYIDIDIYGPNGNEWYEIDAHANTFEDYSGMSANPRPFDRATLERWIANTGGDIKNPDVQQQIDQLYNNIQQSQNAGIARANWSAFSVNSQNNWSDSQPAGWFILLQPVFWVLIYAVGIVLYFFLKSRYDKAMATLRDQAFAPNPHATPSPTHADPGQADPTQPIDPNQSGA